MEQEITHVKTATYEAKPGDVKKVVLLYSGGLDTSVLLKWIKDQYKAEVKEARDYTYAKTKEFYDYLKTYLDTRAAFLQKGLLLHQKFDDV